MEKRRRKRILIVDDEPSCCEVLKEWLEIRGFQVFTATRGEEAIRLARLHSPDVILLDVMMPDLMGSRVAEELAEDPLTRSIPVIFVTGIVKPSEVKKKNGIIGGQTFLAKPVRIDELVMKINALAPEFPTV